MSSPEQLYACLYAKEFATQALLRLRPQLFQKAIVVLEGEPPLQTVCSLNARARRMGVACGMTRVELDTFEGVVALARSRSEEATARRAVLECAATFSPRIEDRAEENAFLCVLDIAGTEKLFGPPRTLAQRLLSQVQAVGISASVAIAGNFHTAMSCVRGAAARITVIDSGNEAIALSPLPIEVLGLSGEHAATFALWGIRTLGQLAALPERELIARMGQAGKRLRQLAAGQLPHHFVPIEASFALEESMQLETPLERLDALLFVVGVMLEQLIQRAAARVLALASVAITLLLEGGALFSRAVRPALPSNDRQLWIKLIHLDLEAHPPTGAILSLTLVAEPGVGSKVQLGLFSPQLPEPLRLDVTLARIRAIVGDEFVGRPVLQDIHRPDGFCMEPFAIPKGHGSAKPSATPRTAMRQLRPPERVSVTLTKRRPVLLWFREKRYDVERAYGPWLAGGDWWSTEAWSIEQWDLMATSPERDLLCCCLVHDVTQRMWQVVALYD